VPPDFLGNHSARRYRGSRKRLQRVAFVGNWSPGFWIVVAVWAFVLFVVIPRLVRNELP